jgi:hypothetical protein
VCILRIYCRKLIPLITFLLVINNPGFSQDKTGRSASAPVIPVPCSQLTDSLCAILQNSNLNVPAKIVSPLSGKKGGYDPYYDSLKQKAAKKNLTKKLYSLVVVNQPSQEQKKISSKSDELYRRYAGKKIRNIEFIRLDVFGTNINNPLNTPSSGSNNVLNKTHMNTREMIIRKNLLFISGDTISPLTLSDNERILRELPFIDDARIIVVPVSEAEDDILVVTKDVYSLGGNYDYGGFKKGTFSAFEKNILGLGHEFGIKIPFDSSLPGSPGIGAHYSINNIAKTFTTLAVEYQTGLGSTSYGATITRNFMSSATKYAGGIQFQQMYTMTKLDTMDRKEPLKYNLQDYWVARSFLVNRETVMRIILGLRYLNNNVFSKPEISPNTYYSLQKYQLFMASMALSVQKFYKTSLIYGYGRTEDIPYGGMIRFTAGREFNEFKERTYVGADISAAQSIQQLGYFYISSSIASFLRGVTREQGIYNARLSYFTNLLPVGRFKSRNFLTFDYSRGIGRYADEHLEFPENNGFTGFRNDSIKGTQRLIISLESVLFSPANYHGFRFAFFGFADLGQLSGSDQMLSSGITLLSVGAGLRIRNDNLLFNTLQVRIAFFPNPPLYSKINNVTISGEQLLKPNNFNAGKPILIPFR